jgi:phosphotransacetylase
MGRWAGAEPVGPILLGIRRPVAVLPRNSSVPAIVNMTAFTVTKAQTGEVSGPLQKGR